MHESLGEHFRAHAERAGLDVDVEKRRRLGTAERGQALADLGQVAGDQHDVADGLDAPGGFGGHDAPVAVRDDDGRLVTAPQLAAHSGDVIVKARSPCPCRQPCLAATR